MQFSLLRRKQTVRPRMLLLMLVVVSLVACLACNSGDSQNNSAQGNSTQGNTPSGANMPRTSLPMPPATVASHSTAANASGFTLLDNRRMKLSDYEGQVVVLDFYATWCPPCREETPHLVELQRRYGAKGLHIVGLNVGGPDDRDRVADFVTEFKIPYALGYPDPQMTDLYMSDDGSIPQAFVFDRKGKLIKRFISYTPQTSAELERTIQTAIAE